MKFDKSFLRNQFLLQRKKKHFNAKKFNFKLIFNLIRQHFHKRKIIIAGYYPANYEVNIINFLKEASKKILELHCQLLNHQTKCLFTHGFSMNHFI